MKEHEPVPAQTEEVQNRMVEEPSTIESRPGAGRAGLLALQRTTGNQAVLRLLRAHAIQAKAASASKAAHASRPQIAPPDHPYEREADRVAEAVLRAPGRSIAPAVPPVQPLHVPPIRRAEAGDQIASASEAGELDEALQGKTAGARPSTLGPAPAPPDDPSDGQDVPGSLRHQGAPLPASTRSFFEPRFSRDLGQVRIHANARAAGLARALQAQAFTLGRHVVFGAGRYAPETAAGQRLLAHELAHVVQPQPAGEGALAWLKPEASSGEKLEEMGDDFYLLNSRDNTTWTIYAGDTPWIVIKQPKWNTPKVEVDRGRMKDNAGIILGEMVGVFIHSDANLDVTVDRTVEDRLLPTMVGEDVRVEYWFLFPGKQTGIDAPGLGPPFTFRVRIERPPLEVFSEVPHEEQPTKRTEELRTMDMPDTFQSFDDAEQLRGFLKQNSKRDFVILQMPDGRYLARPLTEKQLQRLAEDARRSRYGIGNLNYVPWYKGEHARGRFDSVFIHGEELTAMDDLANRYFGSSKDAAKGAQGEPAEAEVYRMGYMSYGRKPLTHAEALARWRELDKLTQAEVDALETMPGHDFVGLQVRGVAHLHLLDLGYFQGRKAYRDMIAALDKTGDDEERQRIIGKTSVSALEDFLFVEADREEDEPSVIASLHKYEAVVETLSSVLYGQVQEWAQKKAVSILDGQADQIASIIESDARFQRFILSFHALKPQAQREALEVMGVPQADISSTTAVLGDKEKGARVALGATVGGVSLAGMRTAARENLKGVRQVAQDLRDKKAIALRVEGPFGNELRKLTYKEFGFKTLDPLKFPHRDRTPDFFPDAMGGKRETFSSLGEQLFAAEAKRLDSYDRLEAILTIAGIVVVTVVLIIAANAAGAAIAGGVFGLAEGSTAFLATQAVVAGVILTGVEVGADVALFKQELSAGDVAEKLLWNVGTGFSFGALGKLLKGAGTGLRIGATGAAFLGVSLGHYYIQHKRVPTGDEFYWFLYENALTFAMMEVGTVLARPMMQDIGLWGRARSLGEHETAINNLVADSGRLNRDLAALYIKPQRAQAEVPALQARAETLLAQQETIVKELRTRLAGRVAARTLDAEVKVELEQIRAALHGIREAEFLSGIDVKAVGESQSLFEYKPQPDAAARFRKFFPQGSQVTEESSGRIELVLPGTREPLVFVPRGTVTRAPAATPGTPKQREPVSINHATEEELMTLPGIGEKLARAIVEYRNEALSQDRTPFPTVDDLTNVPGIGRKTLNGVLPYITTRAPSPGLSLADRQSALASRQASLLTRAERLGVSGDDVKAIDGVRLRPYATTTEQGLKKAEARLDAAEKKIGARLKQRSEASLKTATARLGEDPVAALAKDQLSGASREEVGAAIYWANRYKVGRALTTTELRGLLHAQRGGVSLEKFFGTASGMPEEQVKFTLDTFARLADARVTGARRVLIDMSGGRLKWDGGLWAMETARFEFGIENIKGFEITFEGQGARRDYDIVLKSDEQIELKNWTAWDKGVARFGDQFVNSVKLSGNDPAVFGKLRIVFRHGVPQSEASIKSFLRGRLNEYLSAEVAAKRMTKGQAKALREAFDAADALVKISTTRRAGSVRRPPAEPDWAKPVPDRDEEER